MWMTSLGRCRLISSYTIFPSTLVDLHRHLFLFPAVWSYNAHSKSPYDPAWWDALNYSTPILCSNIWDYQTSPPTLLITYLSSRRFIDTYLGNCIMILETGLYTIPQYDYTWVPRTYTSSWPEPLIQWRSERGGYLLSSISAVLSIRALHCSGILTFPYWELNWNIQWADSGNSTVIPCLAPVLPTTMYIPMKRCKFPVPITTSNGLQFFNRGPHETDWSLPETQENHRWQYSEHEL